ncbi:Hypothetical predicted protein [Octopus vulgaris]|uniref:Uncharacterized protein n=1 Tax=Octopus vulgaris TaxID=6645 RepID=A0AA36B3Z2_OCTVU|nr:Hypothetical predicted protein [Octopus vulgaris]
MFSAIRDVLFARHCVNTRTKAPSMTPEKYGIVMVSNTEIALLISASTYNIYHLKMIFLKNNILRYNILKHTSIAFFSLRQFNASNFVADETEED